MGTNGWEIKARGPSRGCGRGPGLMAGRGRGQIIRALDYGRGRALGRGNGGTGGK